MQPTSSQVTNNSAHQDGEARAGWWRWICGPLIGALVLIASMYAELSWPVVATLAVTTWVAVWWILEPVPVPVTSLLPMGLFPALGVLSPKDVAQSYGHDLILLLAGGFMLATALEKAGAHRRLALAMVRAFGGTSGKRLLYGFAAAAAVISMWISNTATTLMLLPVAMAVMETYPDKRLAAPLILAIAYAASVGGLGTPIGTPPNLVFMTVYEQTTGTRMGFVEWMSFGIPVVILLCPLIAWWLARGLADSPAAKLPELGQWRVAEKRVLLIFGLTALAWVTRSEPFGGWSQLIGAPGITDAGVALLAVIVMASVSNGEKSRLITWKQAESIPWGALILFGGGITIATAFEKSGLSEVAAASLSGLQGLPILPLMLLLCLGVTLLSEIASNTATAVLLMPILAATGMAAGVDPALFMVPAVLAASCGFMLPVATAPNAIAYATGMVGSQRMLREGAVLDIFGVVVLTLVCYWVFG